MKKGFTLVELMVVVIIIGVLAGIAIPQYLKSVERAEVGRAKANMTFYANAQKLYYADQYTYTSSRDNLIDYVESLVESDKGWVYTVKSGDITVSSFKISAVRQQGKYDNRSIDVDQDGAWTTYDFD